ncbi:hypothetical protein K1719_046968 [Acacia pycnantha]|nr:hypothetical protein K1719_046968 [Acacia pycnantha]
MYSFSTTQLLHCKVNYKDSPTAFWITAVYAEPNFCNRKVLWGDLENLAMHMNEPWVVLGYFNAYQSPADKKGGATPNALSIRDFSTSIKNDDLIEVDTPKSELIAFLAATWLNISRRDPALRETAFDWYARLPAGTINSWADGVTSSFRSSFALKGSRGP